MNAKEYLKQIWWIDKEIKYRQDQADMIRARAEGRSSPQVTDMPKGGHKTDTAGLIVRLAELDKYIREGVIENEEHKALIDKKHKANLFKLQMMPHFEYEK